MAGPLFRATEGDELQAARILIADWFDVHSCRLYAAGKAHPPAKTAGRVGQPRIGNLRGGWASHKHFMHVFSFRVGSVAIEQRRGVFEEFVKETFAIVNKSAHDLRGGRILILDFVN